MALKEQSTYSDNIQRGQDGTAGYQWIDKSNDIRLFYVKKEGESKEQSAATDNQLTTWPFPESGAVLTDR